MVHGESGSGKTALGDILRETAVDSGGYFVSGKFFQTAGRRNEPYAAVMAAFSDLCDLVCQSDDFQGTESGYADEDGRRWALPLE